MACHYIGSTFRRHSFLKEFDLAIIRMIRRKGLGFSFIKDVMEFIIFLRKLLIYLLYSVRIIFRLDGI